MPERIGCVVFLSGWIRRGTSGGGVVGLIAVVLLAVLSFPGRGEAASFPPSEQLLPASTRVWVSVADPQALRKRFEQSAARWPGLRSTHEHVPGWPPAAGENVG